jgi:hypothetical protein
MLLLLLHADTYGDAFAVNFVAAANADAVAANAASADAKCCCFNMQLPVLLQMLRMMQYCCC